MKKKMTPVVVADFHAIEMPSDQSVGRLFGFVFLIVAAWQSRFWSELVISQWVIVPAVVSAAFFVIAQFVPGMLSGLNKAWMAFGGLLGRVVSPIVLFVLFALVIVPGGLLRQIFAKPSIALGKDATAKSYWVLRDPPGPEPETLSRPY